MEIEAKKRFFDALPLFYESNLSNNSTREFKINQLLDEILIFLSSCNDLNKITTEYSVLGQLIRRLNKDKQVLNTIKLYNKLIKCIMCLYRKDPADELEKKVSEWAQNLIRNAIILTHDDISIYGPAESMIYSSPKSDDIIKTFQNRLLTYVNEMKDQRAVQIRIHWISRCGSVVLTLSEPNRELLEVLVDVIPSSEIDFYKMLRLNIVRMTKDGDPWSRRFLVKVTRKHPSIMEDKIIELLSKWNDSYPDEVSNDFDSERCLIIECVSNDEKMFQILITILHLVLVRLKYHSDVLDFIQWMLRKDQKMFFNLYPSHLRSLAYIMDIPDISGLEDSFIYQCVLRILDELLEAIEKTSIKRHEVQMLISHFPIWWNYLKLIYLNDENVRIKVLFLLSFLSNQPFCKLVQDKTVL